MGLLDDAIREHLNLKRRRGADPAEVERDEREALGPVRRAPQEPEDGAVGGEELPEDERFAYDHEQEEGWEGPYDEELDEGGAERYEPPAAAAGPETSHLDEPFDDDEILEPASEPAAQVEEPIAEDELSEPTSGSAVAPPPPAETQPPGREPAKDEQTEEYDVESAEGGDGEKETASEKEAAPEKEAEGKDEDVLEETPDFLQDTPDHDRLWFEQRPPRDFDFDG